MGLPLLREIFAIMALSVLVVYLCRRLRLPAVVGFLLTGILMGPHGLGLIEAVHEVETLAEIGVIFLLFTIGIEFSLQRLLRIRQTILLGGSLQVILSALAVTLIAWRLRRPIGEAIFLGFLVSLSSTAIVLKALQERGESDSPHGSTILGILIFQDLIAVPMLLFVPILSGSAALSGLSLALLAAKGLGIILLTAAAAKWVAPAILHQLARTQSRELFLLGVVVLCLGVAWLTSSLGLSLAMGAFLAGLIVSESEYSHQALGNILPFQDIFTSFFFVSVGMLFDLRFLISHPLGVLLITLGILLGKSILAALASLVLGYPLRSAILTGLALSQVGEFSFILSRAGQAQGLISGDLGQYFLASSVLTMALTPFLVSACPKIADLILKLPWPRRLRRGLVRPGAHRTPQRKDHLMIIGYGINGKNLARTAAAAAIPHVIIEMNPEIVRGERKAGTPIIYGDAGQETVLQHAGVKGARVVVIAISDPAATRRVTALVHRLNPAAALLVRTRYLREVKELKELGATEVIPEEFETSIEIFARVLHRYAREPHEIERLVAKVRADSYEMLRDLSAGPPAKASSLRHLPGMELGILHLAEASSLTGLAAAETGLDRIYGIDLLAIRRGDWLIPNPGPDVKLRGGDFLIVMGPPEGIAEAKTDAAWEPPSD